MSIFTSRVTMTLDVPSDPGQTITIRKLAPRHLEAAAKAQQAVAFEDLRRLGGVAFLKELRSLTDEQREQTSDPLNLYDPIVLMEKGVTAWSYAEDLTRETLEDLDDETARFITTEILRLARPSLYRATDAEEDAQKKG